MHSSQLFRVFRKKFECSFTSDFLKTTTKNLAITKQNNTTTKQRQKQQKPLGKKQGCKNPRFGSNFPSDVSARSEPSFPVAAGRRLFTESWLEKTFPQPDSSYTQSKVPPPV